MVFIAFLSGLSILVYWLPVVFYPSTGAIIGFAVLYGLASGGFVSLMTPCVVVLCDGKVEQLGPKLGAFMFIIAIAYVILPIQLSLRKIAKRYIDTNGYLSALTGLPMLGAIADSASIGYKGLVAFAGAVMTFGGVLVTLTRMKKGGLRMVKV